MPPGDYVLTPVTPGYFWSTTSRSVSAPPAATGQDFTGQNIRKLGTTSSQEGTVGLNDTLTYTVRLIYPQDRSLDRRADFDYTYARYIS